MIEEIKNLRQFLIKRFTDYKVEPSEDLWSRINSRLESGHYTEPVPTRVNELEEMFSDYRVNPSEKVWHNIVRILDAKKITLNAFFSSISDFFILLTRKTAISTLVAFLTIILISIVPKYSNYKENNALLNIGKKPNKDISQEQASISVNQSNAVLSEKVSQPVKTLKDNKGKDKNYIINIKESNDNKIIAKVKTGNIKTNKIKDSKAIRSNNQTIRQKIVKKPSDNLYNKEQKQDDANNNLAYVAKYSQEKIDFKEVENLFSHRFVVNVKNQKTSFAKKVDENLNTKADRLIDSFYRDWAKKFKRNELPWYIEAYLLPYWSSASLLQINNYQVSPQRTSTEYILAKPGTKIGINIGFRPRNVVYETGLTYEGVRTQRDDILYWNKKDTFINVVKDSIGFIFNVKDSTYTTYYSYKYDTTTIESMLRKPFGTKNTYHIIELPFYIGYSFNFDKQFLVIKGGVIMGYLVKTQEYVTTLDENYRQYIQLPERKQLSWAIAVAVNYNYSVTPKFYLSASPCLRYNLTSFYKGYPVRKGALNFGLGLGFKYIF